MIALRYHEFGYTQLRKRLNPEIIDKSLNAAMQKTAMKVRTFISKDVRAKYTIKAGDIGKAVKIQKIKSRDGGRLITYTGQAIPLDKFGAKPKKISTARGPRRGVTVRVRKDRGRKLVSRGFLGNVSGQKAFKRKGSDSLPIRRLLGPAIPQMVSNKITVESVNTKIGQELPLEFQRAMDRFLPKG